MQQKQGFIIFWLSKNWEFPTIMNLRQFMKKKKKKKQIQNLCRH